jgi:hypothetical protein
MPFTKVIVIGKLGEVIKKIVETEMLIEKNPKARVLLVELASYYKVLKAWPIENQQELDMHMSMFRYSLQLYLELEEELIKVNAGYVLEDVCSTVDRYLKAKKDARMRLKQLNSLGRFIGDSIELEVDDELLRDEVTSSTS